MMAAPPHMIILLVCNVILCDSLSLPPLHHIQKVYLCCDFMTLQLLKKPVVVQNAT